MNAIDEGGLGRVCDGDEHAFEAVVTSGDGQRKHSADRLHETVERELATHHPRPERLWFEHASGFQGGEGDGELERGALLADVRRGEVHGDPFLGKVESGIPKRGDDADLALLDGALGEADDVEIGKADRHVDLDLHDDRVDAHERTGVRSGQLPHAPPFGRACPQQGGCLRGAGAGAAPDVVRARRSVRKVGITCV